MSTKHFQEIKVELDGWRQLGSIGKAIIYHDHNGNWAIGSESVVKLREMAKEDADAIRRLITKFQAFKFNVICSGPNEPDRVEIYRQLL